MAYRILLILLVDNWVFVLEMACVVQSLDQCPQHFPWIMLFVMAQKTEFRIVSIFPPMTVDQVKALVLSVTPNIILQMFVLNFFQSLINTFICRLIVSVSKILVSPFDITIY